MNISDRQYIDIAKIIAKNSYCKRHQVGAIIVKDDNIIALGYNGTPRGFTNCCEDEWGHTLPEVLHAESNALAKLTNSCETSEGSTLYTTMAPCIECAKMIIQCGLREVVYLDDYRNNDGIVLLMSASIKVIKLLI